jgi:hypothetical protein
MVAVPAFPETEVWSPVLVPERLEAEAAPVTARVPATTVLPEVALTVNLFVLTEKFPTTPRVRAMVMAPAMADKALS